MEAPDGSESIAFTDAGQWEAWLTDHHGRRDGVWLKIAKKSSGIASITNDEALDVALCYGWINSQRKPYDESYYLQRYSRRRPKSSWSKVNVDKVEALIAAGRMRPPGLAEISAAKTDGRWDAAYESPKNATVPADLTDALAQNQTAKAFFESLNKSDHYMVLLRLMKATTPEDRAARLRTVIETLEAGKKVR